MCGIIGCAGMITFKEETAFKDLLIVDSLRGEDSTGVASVSRMGDVNIAKSVGDPFQLFETKNFTNIMKVNNSVLIGHNRYATVGKVTRQTAHPFEFSKVVGVHNGTLKNKYSLLDGKDFDVDSEALYHHINEKGLNDAVDVADGAYALVWYDKEEHSINFLRNKERPLYTTLSADSKCIWWASEEWMLSVVLAREGIKHLAVMELPIDSHYSFSVPKYNDVIEKAKVRIVEKKAKVHHLAPVLPPQKKTTHSLLGSGADFYQKTFEFTILDVRTDHSASYAILHCNRFPLVDFRCYLSHKDDHDLKAHINEKIRGVVSRLSVSSGTSFWKISPDSVELLRPADKTDRLITEAEFNAKYSNCCWCSSPVSYDEDYKIVGPKDVLCSVCKDVKEVLDNIPNLSLN